MAGLLHKFTAHYAFSTAQQQPSFFTVYDPENRAGTACPTNDTPLNCNLNANFRRYSFKNAHRITTIFCTYQDRTAVLVCAKFCCDQTGKTEHINNKHISIKFEIHPNFLSGTCISDPCYQRSFTHLDGNNITLYVHSGHQITTKLCTYPNNMAVMTSEKLCYYHSVCIWVRVRWYHY